MTTTPNLTLTQYATTDKINWVNEYNKDMLNIDTAVATKANQTSLNATNAIVAQKADKSEVTNIMTPKGNSAYASLPATGNTVGWYYYCPDGDGTHGAGNYVWNGTAWYFGGTGDEGYNILKEDLTNIKSGYFYKLKNYVTVTDNEIVLNNLDINNHKYIITIENTSDGASYIGARAMVNDVQVMDLGTILSNPGDVFTYQFTEQPYANSTVDIKLVDLSWKYVKVNIYAKYEEEIKTRISALEDVIIPQFSISPVHLYKLAYSGGNRIEYSDSYCDAFYVRGLSKVEISCYKYLYYNYVTWLDAGLSVLYYKEETSSTSTELSTFTEEVPTDAYWLIVSNNITNAEKASVKATWDANAKACQLIGTDYYLKKVVWFGTSIPAGGYFGFESARSYPAYVGSMIGAFVINEAVGSSPAHCRRESLVSTANPYGFIGYFDTVSRCLSNSAEMQEWVIANYNNTDVFNYQHLDSIDDDTKTRIRRCGYEKKVDRYLAENCEPDIWVFDHGRNDDFTDEDNFANQSDKKSCFYYQGAMNFIVNRIKSYNPKTRIIMIGHYENQLYPQVAKWQEVVSKYWEIPIFKLWEITGWTQNNVTTTGGWVNHFWVANANPSGVEMTELNIALEDGLHPHSDWSAKTLWYLANHIKKWIVNYTNW